MILHNDSAEPHSPHIAAGWRPVRSFPQHHKYLVANVSNSGMTSKSSCVARASSRKPHPNTHCCVHVYVSGKACGQRLISKQQR